MSKNKVEPLSAHQRYFSDALLKENPMVSMDS